MTDILRTGLDCFTYWSAGTAYESPTWTLSTLIKDESIGLSKGKAEFKSRRSKYSRSKGTVIAATASMKIEYAHGDPFLAALIDSMLNNTVIDMMFAFDANTVSGSDFIRLPMEVFEFPFERNLEDGVMLDVEFAMTEQAKVDGSLVDLEWAQVA